MTIIKIPGPRWINLERVNQIKFGVEITWCRVYWASGDEPLELDRHEAIALITALESLDYVDASDLLATEQDGELWVGNEYDID
jgi:hypothetical protein